MIKRKLGLSALAVSSCMLAQAQTVSQNIGTGQQPMAVAVNETTNKAYVVNHNSNSITVVDGKTRTATVTIQTGAGPEAIAVNSLTNRVYVANSGESSVTVIDGSHDLGRHLADDDAHGSANDSASSDAGAGDRPGGPRRRSVNTCCAPARDR